MTVVARPIKNIKDSSRPIYYKSLSLKNITVDEESRKISGYAAVWGSKDDGNDILLKGCCAKSISERGPESNTNRKIIFLWQHDTEEPLGKILVLKEDDYGLYFEAEIDKIPEGDRALTQLKSGTLNQFSIGFMYVWDKIEYDETKGCWIVSEINLFEISVVSFGSNENTSFLGMKSTQLESERNKLLRKTEQVLKSFSYEDQLQIKQLIAKHISLAETEPAKPLSEGEPKHTEQTTEPDQTTQPGSKSLDNNFFKLTKN